MSASSGGKKKYVNYRNRQRAHMSFFIVVIFFAVFGIIVFAEIFLIDERGRGAGVLVKHGSLVYHSRQQEINEYEESLQVNSNGFLLLIIANNSIYNRISIIKVPKILHDVFP